MINFTDMMSGMTTRKKVIVGLGIAAVVYFGMKFLRR